MSRLTAALAAGLLLAYAALPALSAFSCGATASHACCSRKGEAVRAEVERAPCCKPVVAVQGLAREQAVPQGTGPVLAPLATGWSRAVPVGRLLRRAVSSASPGAPPLGPPLRRRV